jgi:hypothetical protein
MIGWMKRKVERKMTTQLIGGIVRAVLASLGGASLASDGQIDQIVGALAVLVTVAWSVWQKYQASKAAK